MTCSFTAAAATVLPPDRARVFSEPRLQHPEGVAPTGGFVLWLAFDGPKLYAADLGRRHVAEIDTDTAARPLHERHGR